MATLVFRAKYVSELVLTISGTAKRFTYKGKPIDEQKALDMASVAYHYRGSNKARDAAGEVYRNIYGSHIEPVGYVPDLNVWGVDQNKWQ